MTESKAEPAQQELRFVIGALMLVMLLSSLSQTIVSAALPSIVGDLGGLNYLAWIVTAYILAITVVTPVYGKLGDLFGRKIVLQVAIVLFLLGSALCGLAQYTTQLIVFRAIQGLGGGGLLVSSMAAVGDVVSPRERGRYQGYFGAVFGLSTVIGPLLGGYIVEHASWRWLFYVNLPIGVIALAVIAFAFAPPVKRAAPEIDYKGATLLALCLTTLVLATSVGGHTLPWMSPPVLALAAISVLSLLALIRVERRASEPVLPPNLFINRTFCIASAVCFIVGLSMFAAVTFMPVYLQVVQGVTPSRAGLALTPLMGGMLATSVGSGRLISQRGRYRIYPIVGTALIGLGFTLMSWLDTDTSPWIAALGMLVVGLGIGLVMQVMVLAVQNAVDYNNLGVATSGVTLFRSVGAALGVAGAGAIFAAGLENTLLGSLPAGAELVSDPAQIQALPDATRAVYRMAYAGAIHPVFVVTAVIAAAGFFLTLLLREIPLRETVGGGSAVDLADSFAMPRQASSLEELERIIAIATSGANRWEALRRILERLGQSLSPEEWWLLLHIGRAGEVGQVDALEPAQLSARADIVNSLIDQGLLERRDDGDVLVHTAKGSDVYAATVAAFRARLSEAVERWAPEDHDEVRRMLTEFARALVAEMPEPSGRAESGSTL